MQKNWTILAPFRQFWLSCREVAHFLGTCYRVKYFGGVPKGTNMKYVSLEKGWELVNILPAVFKLGAFHLETKLSSSSHLVLEFSFSSTMEMEAKISTSDFLFFFLFFPFSFFSSLWYSRAVSKTTSTKG